MRATPVRRNYRRRLMPWYAAGLCVLTAAVACRVDHGGASGSTPAVGEAAPDFALPDSAGRVTRLASLRGRLVLLSFFCGCAGCRSLAPLWERIHRTSPEVVVLGITALGPAHVQGFREATHATFPILLDGDYAVASRYASLECPRCWVIDERGRIAWAAGPQAQPVAVAAGLRRRLLSSSGWAHEPAFPRPHRSTRAEAEAPPAHLRRVNAGRSDAGM